MMSSKDSERWVTLSGHEDYEVSDMGRVRNKVTGRVRKTVMSSRYHRIRVDGHTISVHRAVLISFVGKVPSKPNALHKDGDRDNNCLKNLYWGTQADNYEDARRSGTNPHGERHGGSKLTKEAAEEISSTPKTPGSGVALADKFGISQQRVCDLRNGRGWVNGLTRE